MKFLQFIALMGLIILANALPAALSAQPFEAIEVTAQKEPRKRGVSFNNANMAKLFDNDNSRIAWMYNWDSVPNGDTHMWYEFVPMLHSDEGAQTGRWFANVDASSKKGNGPIHVLAFNEPDQCGGGGACMIDIGRTVAAFKTWMQPLQNYGDRMKIGAPAVTNGDKGSGGNIMGLAFLKQFVNACSGCQIDFVTIHWYDSAKNVEYFKSHVRSAYAAGNGRQVWITEFGPSGSNEDIENFLKEVLPWLDSQDFVYRYAMQWANPGSVLVNGDGRSLTSIGNLYNTYA